MDGRKSTDREPRQGNLLGKTSSSAQAVDPFSVDRSLPLLFLLFLSCSLSPSSPLLPVSLATSFLSVALFYPSRLLSISFSLFVLPRSTSRHIYPPLPPLFASLLLSRLSPSRDLLAPEESVFLYFLPLLRHDSIRSLPFLPCLPLPSFCPLPSGATSILIFPPPCSSCNFVRQIIFLAFLPNIFRSRFSVFFVLSSFLPSFLRLFAYAHTYTYILHTLETV